MTTNMVGPIWQNVFINPSQQASVPGSQHSPAHVVQPPPVLYVDQSGNLIGEYPAARMSRPHPFNHPYYRRPQSAFDAAVEDVFFSISRPVTTAGRILRFFCRITYRAATFIIRGVCRAGRSLFTRYVQLASMLEIQVLSMGAIALGMGALCIANGGIVFCLSTVSQAIADLVGTSGASLLGVDN